jgi:hypothetical protein
VTDARNVDNPQANFYHGLTDRGSHARGVRTLEHAWNKELPVGTFDELLLGQLRLADEAKRANVTIVDIGSGDGALLKSFFNAPAVLAGSLAFLEKHPEMNLRVIGITDAKTPQEHLQAITLSPAGEQQIQAQNIHYSISRTQTLSKFAQHLNIQEADIILSTWMMTYVGPSTFQQLMTDAIHLLRPNGGQMIVQAYAESEIPGFIRRDPSLAPSLDVRNVDLQQPSLKATLKDQGKRFARIKMNLVTESKHMDRSEKLMQRLGVLSQEDIDAENDIEAKELANGFDLEDIKLRRSTTTQLAPEMELVKRKIEKLKNQKLGLLEQIKNTFSGHAQITYTDSTIIVQKAETPSNAIHMGMYDARKT